MVTEGFGCRSICSGIITTKLSFYYYFFNFLVHLLCNSERGSLASLKRAAIVPRSHGHSQPVSPHVSARIVSRVQTGPWLGKWYGGGLRGSAVIQLQTWAAHGCPRIPLGSDRRGEGATSGWATRCCYLFFHDYVVKHCFQFTL